MNITLLFVDFWGVSGLAVVYYLLRFLSSRLIIVWTVDPSFALVLVVHMMTSCVSHSGEEQSRV